MATNKISRKGDHFNCPIAELNQEQQEMQRAYWRKNQHRYLATNHNAAVQRKGKWRRDHPEEHRVKAAQWYIEHREEIRVRQKRYRTNPANRVASLIRAARYRARTRGLEFGDSLWILAQTPPEGCQCCGAAFDFSRDNRNRSPSLDRLVAGGGYTLENVRIICGECNRLKSNASKERLQSVVVYMTAGGL